MLRKTPVALALLAAWGLIPERAAAQTAVTPPAPAASSVADAGATDPARLLPAARSPAALLPAITSTATRTDRRVDEVPATVTVIKAATIESGGARDVKDLLRNEVDLSVRAAPPRFGAVQGPIGRAGNEGLNIRGLEGNQVLMLIDGIRVPSSFSFGSFATGRADYLALEATQAADVLRGPASTQFGSDGLAGAISLRTRDPSDVLKAGKGLGGFVRLAGAQVDDSLALTAAAALRQGPWEALLLASQRQGQATQSQASNRRWTAGAPRPIRWTTARTCCWPSCSSAPSRHSAWA